MLDSKLLALVLLGLLVGSALYLVNTSYEARRLFTLLDRAQTEQRQLQSEFVRLEAERQAQATPMRVDKVARDKLHMRTATLAVTQDVVDPAAAASGVRP